MERIGSIGLGRMGSAMAQRLKAQGSEVSGWTRSGRQVDGIAPAADLPALVAGSDVLILSLYDDAAVSEMLDQLLQLDLAGKLIIETSTAVPALLIERATAFANKGAGVVDAPISGGPEMVAAGTCGIFLGGTDQAAARAIPVLTQITPRTRHVGPLGAGMVMKTINNSMLQIYVTGLRDMLPLAKRAGIPLADALGILNAGPAGLPMIKDRMAKILGDDPTVGFTLNGIAKDNDVFQRVIAGFGLGSDSLVLAAAGQDVAIQEGLGESDPALAIRAAYDNG